MKNNRNSAFTLVEVVISLVIICIIISGFMKVISTSFKSRKLTEDKNIIINWAQTIMEFMETCSLQDLNGKYTVDDFPGLSQLKAEYNNLDKLVTGVIIKVNKYNDGNINNNLYKINIVINWMTEEQKKVYQLSTLVCQEED